MTCDNQNNNTDNNDCNDCFLLGGSWPTTYHERRINMDSGIILIIASCFIVINPDDSLLDSKL